MKKMSKVVLAFASIFALVGCGGENNGGDTTKTIENAVAVKEETLLSSVKKVTKNLCCGRKSCWF